MPSELWVVHGQRPVLWTLPYRVERIGAGVRMWPALTLRDKEAQAARLLLMSVGENHGTEWFMSFPALRRVAEKVADENAEQYAVWHRPHLKDTGRLVGLKSQKPIEDFTDALFQAGVGSSREEVAVWWQHFRNHMLNWLINKERPVDLGFVTLHQSPRRANWIPRVHLKGQRKVNVPWERSPAKVLAHERFAQSVTAGNMLDFDPDGTIARRIEVEHGRLWRSLVKSVETQRRNLLKKEGYAKHTIRGLARGKEIAAVLYAEYSAGVLALSAAVLPSRYKGSVRLVANGKVGTSSKAQCKRAFRTVVSLLQRGKQKKLDDKFRAKIGKIRKLRELRAVQSAGPDVRNGDGNGTGRVPVPHADKIISSPGQLLEVGAGRE